MADWEALLPVAEAAYAKGDARMDLDRLETVRRYAEAQRRRRVKAQAAADLSSEPDEEKNYGRRARVIADIDSGRSSSEVAARPTKMAGNGISPFESFWESPQPTAYEVDRNRKRAERVYHPPRHKMELARDKMGRVITQGLFQFLVPKPGLPVEPSDYGVERSEEFVLKATPPEKGVLWEESEEFLTDMAGRLLGEDIAEVRRVYTKPGVPSAADRVLRDRVDAKLLELSEDGANMAKLATGIGIYVKPNRGCPAMQAALKRAREYR